MAEIAIAAVVAVKAVGTIAMGVVAKAAAGNLVAQLIVEGAKFALAAGIGALVNALQPNVGNAASPDTWSPDTDAPNAVAMGRVGGVAGFIAHRAAYGPTNRYQSLVTTVSLGPIRGNWTVKFDDETTTFGTNNVATNGAHAGELWCQFRLGVQPETAHTSPTGLDASATLPDWSSDHKMSGKATYLATFKENSKLTEYRGGLPKPSLEFDGGYVYDPRLDSTYPGGSGSCRLATPSTWVWSEDPCIWALNWAIGRWAGNNGSGVYGVPYQSKLMAGIGATLDGIDVAALVNAANVSEANGWKVSAWPTTKDGAHEVYRALLQAGGALPARNAGRISCITRGEVQSSVVTITAADTAGPVEVSLGQSRLERINTILPRHWSPDHDWQMIQIDPVTSSAYVTEDGGITRSRGVDYPYVPDKDQAAQLAYYDIADNRERFSGTVPLMPHMRRLQPGDCFTFSEPGFLLDGVKAKCLRRSVDPMSLQMTVTWRQETDAKHTAAAAVTGTTTTGTSPTTPPSVAVDPPTSLAVSVSGDEVTLTWTNGDVNYFRTVILQSPTSSLADSYEIAGRNAAGLSAQTAKFKPGPGTWWWWIKGVDGPGLEQSSEVGPVTATVGGPAVATITGIGDLAVKDTIGTADVDANAIVAIDAFDTFTEPVTTSGATTSGTAVTVMEFEVTSAGEPLLIRPSMMCRFWHASAGDFDFTLRFIRVGGGTVRSDMTIVGINGDLFHGMLAPEFIDQPASGTHTYQVRAWASTDIGFTHRDFTDLTATVLHLKTSTI